MVPVEESVLVPVAVEVPVFVSVDAALVAAGFTEAAVAACGVRVTVVAATTPTAKTRAPAAAVVFNHTDDNSGSPALCRALREYPAQKRMGSPTSHAGKPHAHPN